MLNIQFGEMADSVYNTNIYFNNTYKDKWLTKPLAKEIIKDIDKSDVIDEKTILSPVFGNMNPKKLSGGAKTVLLVAFDRSGKVFNASTCGDNCAKWLLKIAEDKRVVINLNHLMDFGGSEFRIRILNSNQIVNNMSELVAEAGKYV